MKLRVARFTVPDCALAEPMPGKMFKLLIYLIKISRYGGECRPGYKAMKHAMRDCDGDAGSNHTVRSALTELKRRGWIFNMRKTNGLMAIYLQIPLRFRKIEPEKKTIRLCTHSTIGCAVSETTGSALSAAQPEVHSVHPPQR